MEEIRQIDLQSKMGKLKKLKNKYILFFFLAGFASYGTRKLEIYSTTYNYHYPDVFVIGVEILAWILVIVFGNMLKCL